MLLLFLFIDHGLHGW